MVAVHNYNLLVLTPALLIERIVLIVGLVCAGEDTVLGDQPYRYLTVDEMKSLGDDSLPIDVTRDERADNRDSVGK